MTPQSVDASQQPWILVSTEDGSASNGWLVDSFSDFAHVRIRFPEFVWLGKAHYYADRQWGDLLIQNSVRLWHWAHIVTDAASLVLFSIETVWGKRVFRKYEALRKSPGVAYHETNFELYRSSDGARYFYRDGAAASELPVHAQVRRRREAICNSVHLEFFREQLAGNLNNKNALGIAERMEIRDAS
jgi:hypothetical protein